MGRLAGDQDRLFYEFNLDAVVPADQYPGSHCTAAAACIEVVKLQALSGRLK